MHDKYGASHKQAQQKSLSSEAAAGCNCQGGLNSCPVDGACQTKGVVYQATVLREDNGIKETYTGLTSRHFKDRYYKHRQNFNSEAREGTSLSNK